MKIFNALLAISLLTACTSSTHVEFTGKAPGLTNGVFLIKDGNNTLYSDEIKTGAFHAVGELERPGYYSLSIMDNSHPVSRDPFEIYLEPGNYTLQTSADQLANYPDIKSSSKNQQDLSAYYAIYDKGKAGIDDELNKINKTLKEKKTTLSNDAYVKLYAKLADAETQKGKITLVAFKEFMAQHPQSAIAAHLMAQMNYMENPAPYYAIYQKMSPAAKNTDEGKEVGLKLSTILKLQPGATAPNIAGTTPDGQKFDAKALNKKIYVIDFWRAGNEVSRLNHQDMLGNLLTHIDTKKAGIISISLDSKRDWWTTAIKDDHLTWPQYADLKGDDSANAQHWMITSIPTYYLVDQNWHIVQRDVSYNRLNFEITDYLKHHH